MSQYFGDGGKENVVDMLHLLERMKQLNLELAPKKPVMA